MVAMENILVWADRVLLPIINADRSVSSSELKTIINE